MPSWARGERHGLETRACRAPGRRRGPGQGFLSGAGGLRPPRGSSRGGDLPVVQVTPPARRAPLPSWPTPGPPARSRASTSSSTTSTPHTTSSPPVGPDRARSSTSTPGRRSRAPTRAPGLQLVPQFRRPRRQRLAGPRSAGVLRPGRGERPGLSRVLAGGPGPVSRRGGRTASVPGHDGVVGTTLAGALSAWCSTRSRAPRSMMSSSPRWLRCRSHWHHRPPAPHRSTGRPPRQRPGPPVSSRCRSTIRWPADRSPPSSRPGHCSRRRNEQQTALH